MRGQIGGILAAGLGATGVALVLGLVTLPLVAIAAGAVTAFLVTRSVGVQRHYDAVGTVYFLALGAVVYLVPFLPTAFKQTPQFFLVVFGLLSAAIVVVKRGVSVVLGHVGERLGRGDSASSIWNAVSSLVGALVLVWSIVKMKQRLTKTAVTGAATPLGLLLNVLGHFVDLPWILSYGVDVTAMVFVGGVMVGFHTLTSWYEVLALRTDPLVQAVAKKSRDTAATAASKTRETASAHSGTDAVGSGLMSQVLGVTPATTAGAPSPNAGPDDAPAPDERDEAAESIQTMNTQPNDDRDESTDSADEGSAAGAAEPVEATGATASVGTDGTEGVADRESGTDGSAGLDAAADRLDLPPEPGPVAEGIETMTAAIDAVIDDTDAVEAGLVDGESPPAERAASVKRAADGGTLFEDEAPADRPEADRQTEHLPGALTDAVETARRRAAPKTSEGQDLVDSLRLANDVSERHLATTLGAVLERLNAHEDVATALAEVGPSAEPREIARLLDRHSSAIDSPAGTGLSTIADELDSAVAELEQSREQRRRLAESAEAICTAANDQTTVRFDSSASTDQWLDALAAHVADGTVSFTDQATDVGRLVSNVEGDVRPQSSLARSVAEALRSDSMAADAREQTLADALEAIDSTETLRHRLDGVAPDEVASLARRLAQDLSEMNTAGSSALADRVEELQRTVTQADTADLMTVYAARQELRFYDEQLLDALRRTPEEGTARAVADRYERVRQRRSRMRSEYPSDYPNHDHSIPIHFIELVEALEESADQARASGNEERAVGYLQAADRTLDWVAELYERHTYNVLLEQLRG